MDLNLKSQIIHVLDDYAKPMELSVLVSELNARTPHKYRRIDVKKELMKSEEFFLVDLYNGGMAKIWSLSKWSREKRSIISYTDWDQYNPRIGKVVEEILSILKGAINPLRIEDIRDRLEGAKHHKSVLRQVVEHDPLFEVTDGWVRRNPEDLSSNSFDLQEAPEYNSLSDFIFVSQQIVTQASIELVCQRFLKRFPNCFSMEDINFWAELFGLRAEEVLSALHQEVKLWDIGNGVFLAAQVNDWSDLEQIMSHYDLSMVELSPVFGAAFIQAEGNINRVPEFIPFAIPVIECWLKEQNNLIMVSSGYWLPGSSIPKQVRILAEFRSKLVEDFQVLIVQSLIRKGTPLTIKEIIFYSIGIVNPFEKLKCLYSFVLELLNNEYVYQVPGTEYWALKKWAPLLDINIIQRIMARLDDEDEPVSLETIIEILKQHQICLADKELEALLLLWPEVEQTEGGLFRIRASMLEIDPEILKPYLMNILREATDGTSLGDLHEYLSNCLVSHNTTISKRELKLFLQSWGDVAIIRSKVFLMEKAPLSCMRLGDIAYQIVNEIGQPVQFSRLELEMKKRSNYTGSISSVLLSEPKLMRPSRGYYALRDWELPEYDPEIHNQISDILVNIIEQAGRPLHKSEIRRQLRRMGIRMNETTLQIDIVEEERIEQVARGVYALSKWSLQFRDLLKHEFPFRLQLPDGEQNIYELEEGIVFECMVTRYCLEFGRILIRRYMSPYFSHMEPQLRFTLTDIDGDSYLAWADRISDNRWQVLGVRRWYKTNKIRYGDSIYIKQQYDDPCQLQIYTAEQVEKHLGL